MVSPEIEELFNMMEEVIVAATQMVASDEYAEFAKTLAKSHIVYFNQLRAEGISSENAARMTAAFIQSTAQMNKGG